MILEEFISLMNNFIYDDFPVRELPILFVNSMRIQLNEIESDKHYNMSFPEFLEAFSRVIDKASPIPDGENLVNKFFFINLKFKFFLLFIFEKQKILIINDIYYLG